VLVGEEQCFGNQRPLCKPRRRSWIRYREQSVGQKREAKGALQGEDGEVIAAVGGRRPYIGPTIKFRRSRR
jgi:hypothetical protein